jgi:hypothetical protein
MKTEETGKKNKKKVGRGKRKTTSLHWQHPSTA